MNVLGMVFSMCGLMMRVSDISLFQQYSVWSMFWWYKLNLFSWNGVPGLLCTALALVLPVPKSMTTPNRSSAASCNSFQFLTHYLSCWITFLFPLNILGFPFLLLSCLIFKTQLLWSYPGQVFEDHHHFNKKTTLIWIDCPRINILNSFYSRHTGINILVNLTMAARSNSQRGIKI